MSDIVTGLYPSGKGHNTSFNVKSDFIKVFPSSWRGADFKPTEVRDPESGEQTGAYVAEGKKQFNPESVLNTEYNITRTAGGIKSFIDYAQAKTLTDERISKEVYDLKFFIEGYAFEIFNLDLSRYEYPDNDLSKNPIKAEKFDLYAGIRVGDLEIGDADLDDTKVLMPYYWTAINTPIPLDATLRDAYLIDADDETSFNSILSELTGGVKIDDIKNHEDTTYIFTGLVLSTEPLQDNDNYYSLKLFENGELCYGNFWPSEVKGGRSDGKSTVIGKAGLKADVAHMLAVGQFNTTSGTSATEKTIFAVGNGFDDNSRRNAFEVTGYTDNTGDFKSTVKAGGVKFTYSKDKEAINRGDIEALHLINERTEILEDGSGIIVNRPIGDTFKQHPEIGIHSYGNINLLSKAENNGSKLQFKDISWTGTHFDEKIISTFQVVEVATGPSNIIDPDARGLKITNVHEINEEALLFRPCNAGLVRSQLKTINKGIDIDNMPNYKHSIKIGLDSNESAALALAHDKLVIKSDSTGEFINNIRIKQESDTNTDNLFNVAGIYNDNDKNDTSSVTFDGKVIKLNGDVEITGKSTFRGLMDVEVNNDDLEQDGLAKYICNLIYPVGSIYMTMENINPAAKFGGTWKQISQGRMLIGAGTGTDLNNESNTFNGPSKQNPTPTTGGYYKAQLANHTHGAGTLKINAQYTAKCEPTNFTYSTSTKDFIETANASPVHNHIITGNGLHSHNIPVSYPTGYSGYLAYQDPRAFLSIDKGINGNDLYADYKGYKFSNSSRYWGLINEKIKAPIPLVSMGTWLEGYHILNWCETPNEAGREIRPKLSDNKESNVRTGYFGIEGVSEQNFKNYVEKLFRTTFIHNLVLADGDSGSGGTGDGYANDEFKVRPGFTDCVKYFYVPEEDINFWHDTMGWQIDINNVDTYGKAEFSDGDHNWCYNDTYECLHGNCYKVLNKTAGHTEWLFKDNGTVSTNKEVEKYTIKDAFMRDLFNAIENGKRLHRDDGYHKHECNYCSIDDIRHNHQISLNALSHNHKLENMNMSGKTASTGADNASNLPPYLVCYIWQRIK
ncbi:MAG: hypothetical protein J6A25_00900 [Lachnospiraceae bacterium]|nr:hypothetical protein [Lachnospiraceae bacterium]